MNYEKLDSRIDVANNRIQYLYGKYRAMIDERNKLKSTILRLSDLEKEIELSIEILQILSDLKKKKIKLKIEKLVTNGLRSIFKRDDLEFVLDMEQKRGVMNAKPMIRSTYIGQSFLASIVDSHGGGVVDIVSLILQVIVLLSLRPKVNHVLIMDEAFKHVSREYLENVSSFLHYLSTVTKIQFILVTHKPELIKRADKVFNVKLDSNGISKIKEIPLEQI